MPPFRCIIDIAHDGASNMARDEALLQCVGLGQSPATLRFYRWSTPTVSLGYFQPYEQFTALPPPVCDLPVVRRQTGGGAIIHDQELTFALVLPLAHPLLVDGGPNTLYDHVNAVVTTLLNRHGLTLTPGPPGIAGFSQRGPFFCFERHTCFDLLVGGNKIMGSAQRRTRQAVLQHGSLILDRRFNQQQCAAVSDFIEFNIDEHLPELADMIATTSTSMQNCLTKAECELADELRDKYNNPAWTQRR